MNKIKFALLTILLFIIGINGSAQVFKESGINIGINAGGAKLIAEFADNRSIQEFNNNIGFASGIEISKAFFSHIEFGAEIRYSNINGDTEKTNHFSAIGFHHAFQEPITGPTEYINKLFGQSTFVRYYFSDVTERPLANPFVKLGFGFLKYKSTFKYVDGENIIFGKGNKDQPELSTGMLTLGTGLKTNLGSGFHLIMAIDFNMVKYDFLDVVHNYDNSGNRTKPIGLYSEFKVGILYNKMNSDKKGISHQNQSNLPFAR